MSTYVGSGLVFPIKGTEKIGMELTLDVSKLDEIISQSTESYVKLLILPLKAENVNEKKTHSVKLKVQ